VKGQGQQPPSADPNANPASRGAGNGMGATASPPGGKGQSMQPPPPDALHPTTPSAPPTMTPLGPESNLQWASGPSGSTSGGETSSTTYQTPQTIADPGTGTQIPYGANAGLPATQLADPNAGTQSFQNQGFSGVSTQPGSSQSAQIAQQGAPGTNGIAAPKPMDTSGTLPGTKSVETPMTANNLPQGNIPPLVGGDALGNAMRDAQNAAYKNATGYLDPQYANSQHDLEAKLANQGIPQNSEAWNRAMDEFNRGKTFAYGQAESGAVQQGNAAQSQLFNQGLAANQSQFGQNLQGAQFSETQRQNLVNEGFTKEQIDNLEQQHRFDNSMTMRNQDINELLLKQQNPLQMYNQLNSGGNVTQPNFTSTPGANVGGTDIAQLIQQMYGGQLNAYNASTGNANSNNAAMAQIIAAIICDRRLKKNVRMIGMHIVGVPLYEFEYLWGERGVGVMADELEEVMPEAIIHLRCGYKAVNYARLQ